MSEKLDPKLKELLGEVNKRAARVANLNWDRLMFDKQREFIEDPARMKAACCGRRAGKSTGIGLALLKMGFKYPGSFPVYINMNRASAKAIIWPTLKEIDREQNLGLKFENTTGDIWLPNDSKILVFGAGSKREMDKQRGIKTPLACLDEAQNMGQDMLYLLTEVLLPATFDFKGQILVTGTPSNTRHNPFYKIANNIPLSKRGGKMEWSVHHWTMHDNPHIPDVEEQMELVKTTMGWSGNTPAYRREMLGEWVFDSDRKVFHVNDRNIVDRFPIENAEDWRWVLGVDLGTAEPCAFTVVAYSRNLAQAYVVSSYRKPDLSTIDAGVEIEKLKTRYPKFNSIVVDSGGQGAGFVRQWKDSHPDLAAKPVKKGRDSVDMGVSVLNAQMRTGQVFFVEPNCQDLLGELDTLQWDEKAEAVGKRAVKKGLDDHAADSLRYAMTKVRLGTTDGWVVDDAPKTSQDRMNQVMAERKASELRGGKEEPLWVKVGKWKRPGRNLR